MAAEVDKRNEPSEQDKEFEVAQFLAGLATKTTAVAQEEESVLPESLIGIYSEPTLDECRHVTSELCHHAYQFVCMAMRSMGPLTEYNASVLEHLQYALQITSERAAAERRAALNDEKLEAIARKQNPAIDINASWLASSRGLRFILDTKAPAFNDAKLRTLVNEATAQQAHFNNTQEALNDLKALQPRPHVNEGLRAAAELALSEATEKAANAARQNLTYVQMAQAQADKIAAEIAPAVSAPTVTTKGAAKTPRQPITQILPNGMQVVRKPRGRPPGSGKNQTGQAGATAKRKRQANADMSPIVLDENSTASSATDTSTTPKRGRQASNAQNDSCARVRPFDRETFKLHKPATTNAQGQIVNGAQVVKKPTLHPAAHVLMPPGIPSKARSLTLQQYHEVVHRMAPATNSSVVNGANSPTVQTQVTVTPVRVQQTAPTAPGTRPVLLVPPASALSRPQVVHNLQQSAATAAQATVTFNGVQQAAPVYTSTIVTNTPSSVVPLMQSRAGNHLPTVTTGTDTLIHKQTSLAEKPLDAPLQAIITSEEAPATVVYTGAESETVTAANDKWTKAPTPEYIEEKHLYTINDPTRAAVLVEQTGKEAVPLPPAAEAVATL